MHKNFGKECGSLFMLLLFLCFSAAFGLVVHNLPKVNATGSTMRLVSRTTEMSNKYGSPAQIAVPSSASPSSAGDLA